ncbi:MAG: universal stress protein [Hyphomicrobiaceae bacterium]|nr:universal stress protein [Hyphomicrobiaceae bacterium]
MTVILHPTDGSESASKALGFACDLAASKKAKLLLVHVQRRQGSPQIPPEMAEFERLEHMWASEGALLRAAAEQILAEAADAARSKGLADVETQLLVGDPTHQIVECARKHDAEMVVMGSRGLGDLEGLFMGSVSHKVAHAAPCTCVIVR